MDFFEVLKVLLIGIVEGITEWLPVSSTGHIILMQEFLPLNGVSEGFEEMFNVVIQLGAIIAVIVIFWNKLFPFVGGKNRQLSRDGMHTVSDRGVVVLPLGLAWKKFILWLTNLFRSEGEKRYISDVESVKKEHCFYIKKDVLWMWWMVVVACIPTALIGLILDDIIEAYLSTPFVIALTLIIYGILFIVVENYNKKRMPKMNEVRDFTWQTAFYIGLFQCLAMIPGTSRSGATIIGALLLGVSRTAAAEYTFFLAIPTMFGASLLKMVKFFFNSEVGMKAAEWGYLLIGMAVAFLVSLAVIKFLMNFVRKHDFKVFGYYRILLAIAVLVVFSLRGSLFA